MFARSVCLGVWGLCTSVATTTCKILRDVFNPSRNRTNIGVVFVGNHGNSEFLGEGDDTMLELVKYFITSGFPEDVFIALRPKDSSELSRCFPKRLPPGAGAEYYLMKDPDGGGHVTRVSAPFTLSFFLNLILLICHNKLALSRCRTSVCVASFKLLLKLFGKLFLLLFLKQFYADLL